LKKQSLIEKQKEIKDEIRKIVIKPENIVPFLVPGRVIHIKTGKDDWGWGVLSSFSK
jgi:ATP-dependent RNA helicase DOB1